MRRRSLREAGIVAAIGLGADTGLALIIAQVGWARSAAGLLAAGAAVAASWVGVRWLQARAGLANPSWAPAQLAEALAPELGSAPTSAVHLPRRLDAGDATFSRPLAESHLESTAQTLGQLDLPARLQAHDRQRRLRLRAGLAGSVVWAVVLTASLGAGRNRLKTLIFDPHAAHMSDVPLAGDIRLTYHYPEYTGLAPRVVQGGDGSIQAVVGTEVELDALAESVVRKGLLRMENMAGGDRQDIPMEATGRKIGAKVQVLRDGRYHFVLVNDDGDTLEDRQKHAVHAQLDESPEIHMDDPAADVELRDSQNVAIRWRAKDDFGVSDVQLVIEKPGEAEPQKIALTGDSGDRREGVYNWSVAELHLEPGKEVRFHLDAADNDAINGPKHSVSATRKLVVFSARQHHEELVAKEHAVLDGMVDWLGAELVAPVPPGDKNSAGVKAQTAILERITQLAAALHELTDSLKTDHMTGPEVVAAFANVLEHVDGAKQQRATVMSMLGKLADAGSGSLVGRLVVLQQRDVKQLEKDIIYLDDLLAIARIDELKRTAKDLLSAQRDLQDLLQQYRENKNPALRAELQERINDLRQKMMDLLAKMGDIKKSLPGEYRNMEADSMLRLDDELSRLEKTLKEGDLDRAAQELEQLANMVENMVSSINNAEQEYGGDRYKDVRGQLQEFAERFKELENEQQAVSQRSDEMLRDYRKKAVERAGSSLESFVKKAREHTREALKSLDGVGDRQDVARQFDRDLDAARQGLLDLDALLAHRDFAEARQVSQQALMAGEQLASRLQNSVERYPAMSRAELSGAGKDSGRAVEHAREVVSMLDRLFPDASQVLSPEQMAQMQRMGKKQQSLEQEARALQQKMEQLASELPLFGGEPRASLDGARAEMEQAGRDIQSGELPGGAGHGRRASEQLGKLREALEKASQSGGRGGLPLPLGASEGGGNDGGNAMNDASQREVEIPKADRNRASPRFRQELMDAAKQKSPTHFEDAVRRYYEELIR